MSFSLTEKINDQLNDKIIGQLGNIIGGSEAQNSLAISSAIPGILSGLINAGSSDKGAESLFNAIENQDDSILDNLDDLFVGDRKTSIIEMGTNALSSILSDAGGLDNLTSAISEFTGTNERNAGSLIGLLASIIFGVVKRKLLSGEETFDIGSLTGMLYGQKANITAAMPFGFSDELTSSGFDMIGVSLTEKVEGVVDKAINSTHKAAVEKQSKSMLTRLLPIAIFAGAVLLAYNFYYKSDYAENIGYQNTNNMQSLRLDSFG